MLSTKMLLMKCQSTYDNMLPRNKPDKITRFSHAVVRIFCPVVYYYLVLGACGIQESESCKLCRACFCNNVQALKNQSVGIALWLAKWCKSHKVYIHSHLMLLLLFTNIFIHIQQLNLYSRDILIHI